jgi:hypothetical protein
MENYFFQCVDSISTISQESIYKNNKNSSLLSLMERIKIEWKLLLHPQTNTNLFPTIKSNLQIK